MAFCALLPPGTSPECDAHNAVVNAADRTAASATTAPDAMAAAATPPPSSAAVGIVDPEFQFIGTERLPADQVMKDRSSFEGDILGYDMAVTGSATTDELAKQSANFIKDKQRKWPRGTVPFHLSKYFMPDDASKVRRALQSFSAKTGIVFVEQTTETDYVYIGPGIGCQSHTGKQNGRQYLSLQMPECRPVGIIHHELMHTVGFYHEQSRTDRDQYVQINWDNIAESDRSQFLKYSAEEITAFGEEYDFQSIMHYGQYDFAKDPTQFTIQPLPDKLPPGGLQVMGQRTALSAVDTKKIRLAYPSSDNRACPTEDGWVKLGEKKCYYFSFLANNRVQRFVEGRNYCRMWSAQPATEQTNSLVYIHSVMQQNGAVLPGDAAVWLANCRSITAAIPDVTDSECTADEPRHFICYKRLQLDDP
ncbi:hatching enzyme 1.2-like isoform X2 [Paramacrobiotus metropolitanus]|nr:hatching enzyme 1.2-like isoform X2 [Paramacrobiotus metropolitanus]